MGSLNQGKRKAPASMIGFAARLSGFVRDAAIASVEAPITAQR